jgi:short-subunit dehydrogenase
MSYKDKVIIITGATSGIGKSIAFSLCKFDAKIVIVGRNYDKLLSTSNELSVLGAVNLPLVCDVSVESDCNNMINNVLSHFGRVDILINNAGISMRALFKDLDLSVLHQLMNINFWGAVYCTKFALPEITKNKGSIVAISSIAGYRGLPARTGYSASKFAMQGFFEALRTELLGTGVNVLIACPGYTASNIRKSALLLDGSTQNDTPLAEDGLMSSDEVASIIINAMIKRKKIITLTTKGKLTVLLNKFFPIFMDKLVYNALKKEPNSPF